MRKTLIIFLAAALAAFSCGKEPRPGDVGSSEVKFTAGIVGTYDVKAGDAAFDNADEIGIFAGAPIGKNNVKAVYSAGKLSLSTPINWVEGSSAAVKFTAYHPYVSSAAKNLSFAVQQDQSTVGAYKKSDLLIANTSASPTRDPVALEFHHALSKVVIEVTSQIDGATVTGVEFVNVSTSGTVNLESGSVSGLASANKTVKALSQGGRYQLLVLPQTASPKIRVSMSNGATYVFEPKTVFTFAPGKKYSAVVSPALPDVEFTFSVTDWMQETDAIDYGEPAEQSASWGVVGLGGNWNSDIAMTRTIAGENPCDGVWEADIDYTECDEFKLRLNGSWAVNAGMNTSWTYYGTGEFDDGYLMQDGANIVLVEGSGSYHLKFTYPSYRFVISKNS